MKTVNINIYAFKELSEKAKQKAIDWYRSMIDSDSTCLEFFLDECEGQLYSLGFEDVKIFYSGFGHQGSGAMFEGVWHPSKFIENIDKIKSMGCFAFNSQDIQGYIDRLNHLSKLGAIHSIKITHRGHYYHSKCRSIEYFYNEELPDDKIDELALEKEFEELYSDLCHDIYRGLEKEYEHQMSDEVISENIINGYYYFLESGKYWYNENY